MAGERGEEVAGGVAGLADAGAHVDYVLPLREPLIAPPDESSGQRQRGLNRKELLGEVAAVYIGSVISLSS